MYHLRTLLSCLNRLPSIEEPNYSSLQDALQGNFRKEHRRQTMRRDRVENAKKVIKRFVKLWTNKHRTKKNIAIAEICKLMPTDVSRIAIDYLY